MKPVVLDMLIDDLDLLIGFLWKYQDYWQQKTGHSYADMQGKEWLYLKDACVTAYGYVFGDCLLLLFLP